MVKRHNYKSASQQQSVASNQTTKIQQQTIAIGGPLPASQEFAGYEKVLPGSAERILAMAEKEQEDRMTIAKKTIELQHKQLDNSRAVEITKARGELIYKSASAIVPIVTALIAIFEPKSLAPYFTLVGILVILEVKNFLEKFFLKK